ncbi:MAG: type II toxin-antitoxin system ParD family antitoxin [Gammaproteobacteria bacterium]
MPSSYAVGEHFEQFIKQQVEGGRYASASEVVRDALRLLEEEQQRREATLEALRTEVKKGLASGKGKPAEAVLGRLERKYADMAKSRHSK